MTLKSNTILTRTHILSDPASVSGAALNDSNKDAPSSNYCTESDQLISAILGRLEQQHPRIDLTLDLDNEDPGFPIEMVELISILDLLSADFSSEITTGNSRLKIISRATSESLTIKFECIHGDIRLHSQKAIEGLMDKTNSSLTVETTMLGIDQYCLNFRDPHTLNLKPVSNQSNRLINHGETKLDGTQSSAEQTHPTILLIEDDHALRGLTELVLTRANYRVLAAQSSAEALDLYTKNELSISFVIADLNLAGESGLDLAEKLWIQNSELQIIFTSGDPQGAMKISSLDTHPIAYLEKPYRMSELVPFIRSVTA